MALYSTVEGCDHILQSVGRLWPYTGMAVTIYYIRKDAALHSTVETCGAIFYREDCDPILQRGGCGTISLPEDCGPILHRGRL